MLKKDLDSIAFLAALALLPPAALAQELPSETPPTQENAAEESSQVPGTPQQQELVEKANPNPLTDPRDRIYYPGDTERFKPLMEKLGGNVLLDQKAICTSPFRMHKEDINSWVGFGPATA